MGREAVLERAKNAKRLELLSLMDSSLRVNEGCFAIVSICSWTQRVAFLALVALLTTSNDAMLRVSHFEHSVPKRPHATTSLMTMVHRVFTDS